MRHLTYFRTGRGTWKCVVGYPRTAVDRLTRLLPEFDACEDAERWALYRPALVEVFEEHVTQERCRCRDRSDCLETLLARADRRRITKYRQLAHREASGRCDRTSADSLRYTVVENLPHADLPNLVSNRDFSI